MGVLTEYKTKRSGRSTARPNRDQNQARLTWPLRVGQVISTGLGWVPVTPVGLFTATVLTVLIQKVALPQQDKVLLTLATAGLVYQAIATVVVVGTAIWLRIRPQGRAGPAIKCEVGKPFTTDYSPGWASWNLLTRIEITWISSAGSVVRLVSRRFQTVEEVTVLERMGPGRLRRRFLVGDIAHLARIRFVRGREESITIRPSRGAVTHLKPAAQVVSGDDIADPDGKPEGELIEMRRYSAGDPLKLVLWKLYARTGQLMVRTPERSNSLNEATRAFLVAGAGDEPSAGIARGWIESGGLGIGSTFGADGRPGSATTVGDALDRVVHSVGSRDQGGSGLADFLDQRSQSGVTGCLLFVPSQPGAWLLRTIQALGGRRGMVRAIIGVDGVNQWQAESRLTRLLTRRDEQSGANPEALRTVVERLTSAGVEVTVVDRISGRLVLPAAFTHQMASKEV